MLMIKSHVISLVIVFISLHAIGCDDQDPASMTAQTAGEVTAGTDESAAGTDESIAGTDENAAGTDDASRVEIERPELPQGRDDSFSRRACQLLDLEMTPLIATAEPSSAGQITVLPNEMSAYQVRLPESGVGYITLEVPDWAITVGLFTHYTQSATVDASSGNIEVVGRLSWNASCDDVTDERLHFHSWGSYTVELTGEPSSDVALVLLKRQ